jgi:hypothetical protein
MERVELSMSEIAKTVFSLITCIMVGLSLQGCCFRTTVEASPALTNAVDTLPVRSEDGKAWMKVDTICHALIGYYNAEDRILVDTLAHEYPGLEIYPKCVHSIDASDGSSVYLFLYSRGHLLYEDEVQSYVIDEYGFRPLTLFLYGQWDCKISCMWYDQLVAASDGFPYDEFDEKRFGIHYDRPSKNLYIPIMEHHEKDSGFENCLRYTGRFEVLHFNGEEFVPADEDGAWWLHPSMRNYKRTISNKRTTDGYEQIDLMPDGTYRHAFWQGAKTLDDLQKKPNNMN